MIPLKKTTIKRLAGLLTLLIGAVLSGCSYPENISQDLLNIPDNQRQTVSIKSIMIYGVDFDNQNTSLQIKKFEIQPSDQNTVNVSNGPSYSIYFNGLETFLMDELNAILAQHQINSLWAFKETYSSVDPIFPDTSFRALPENLGQNLFQFAQKNDNGSEPQNWRSGP